MKTQQPAAEGRTAGGSNHPGFRFSVLSSFDFAMLLPPVRLMGGSAAARAPMFFTMTDMTRSAPTYSLFPSHQSHTGRKETCAAPMHTCDRQTLQDESEGQSRVLPRWQKTHVAGDSVHVAAAQQTPQPPQQHVRAASTVPHTHSACVRVCVHEKRKKKDTARNRKARRNGTEHTRRLR